MPDANANSVTGDTPVINSHQNITQISHLIVELDYHSRRPILVGFGEMSFGNSIPEVNLRNEQGNFRSRMSFFYSGQFFWDTMFVKVFDTVGVEA